MPGNDATSVFGEIYRSRLWGGGSGGGSDPQGLRDYIALVEKLLARYQPHSVLDVGCGLAWASALTNWGTAMYVGVDVVPEVVQRAKENFPRGLFYIYDAITQPLPQADLVIVKELFQHLENDSIAKVLNNVRAQRVLHVSMKEATQNLPGPMGCSRGIDLALPPFLLPCENVLTYKIGSMEYLCQLWELGK